MSLAPRLAATLLASGSFAAAGLAAQQQPGGVGARSPGLAALLPATACQAGVLAALPAGLEAAADRWVPEGVVRICVGRGESGAGETVHTAVDGPTTRGDGQTTATLRTPLTWHAPSPHPTVSLRLLPTVLPGLALGGSDPGVHPG